MSLVKNNLEEHVSWLSANLAQAHLYGFTYSAARAEKAASSASVSAPIFVFRSREECQTLVQKHVRDLKFAKNCTAALSDVAIEALKNFRFEQFQAKQSITNADKRRETMYGELRNEFNAPNHSSSSVNPNGPIRTNPAQSIPNEVLDLTRTAPSSTLDDDEELFMSLDVDKLVAQHQQQKEAAATARAGGQRYHSSAPCEDSAANRSACPDDSRSHMLGPNFCRDDDSHRTALMPLSAAVLNQNHVNLSSTDLGSRDNARKSSFGKGPPLQASNQMYTRQPFCDSSRHSEIDKANHDVHGLGSTDAMYNDDDVMESNPFFGNAPSEAWPRQAHSTGFDTTGMRSRGGPDEGRFEPSTTTSHTDSDRRYSSAAAGAFEAGYQGSIQKHHPNIAQERSFQPHYANTAVYDGACSGTAPASVGLECPPAPLDLPELGEGGYATHHSRLMNRVDLFGPSKNFPWKQELHTLNRQVFRNKIFRKHQEEIMNCAKSGHDTFVLMPTGGGKSLCYQLLALSEPGVTIVISPLVSLMQDQVFNLTLVGVGGTCLDANTSWEQSLAVFNAMRTRSDQLKLVYITPEKFSRSESFREEMRKAYESGGLSRIVIDEAHCVSEWGHDFRPDYKSLGRLKDLFPNTNIMALTATATPRVRQDIRHLLQIPNAHMFVQSFNRANLRYEVIKKQKTKCLDNIVQFIKDNYPDETGIVYCLAKWKCDEVATHLMNNGIKAKPYHGGLDPSVRKQNQQEWSDDMCNVIVATIAFGMGINKADVRFVIHESMPKSMEGYYQESGRAGRDGKIAHCILYYSYQDKITHGMMAQRDFDERSPGLRGQALEEATSQYELIKLNLTKMVAYCENVFECRRSQQLGYFGERFAQEKCNRTCDNCMALNNFQDTNLTAEAMSLAGIVGKAGSKGLGLVLKIFRGSNEKACQPFQSDSLWGSGKHLKITDAERLFHKMLQFGILDEKIFTNANFGGTTTHLELGSKHGKLLNGEITINIPVSVDAPKPAKKKAPKSASKEAKGKRKQSGVLETIEDSDEVDDDDDQQNSVHFGAQTNNKMVDMPWISVSQQLALVDKLLEVRKHVRALIKIADSKSALNHLDLIFTKSDIKAMAAACPTSCKELKRHVDARSAINVDKWGQHFVDAIKDYCTTQKIQLPALPGESDAMADGEENTGVQSRFFTAGISSKKRRRESAEVSASRNRVFQAEDSDEDDDDFVGTKAKKLKRSAQPADGKDHSTIHAQNGLQFHQLLDHGTIESFIQHCDGRPTGSGVITLKEAVVQVRSVLERDKGDKIRVSISDGIHLHDAILSTEASAKFGRALGAFHIVRITRHKVNPLRSGLVIWIIEDLSVVDTSPKQMLGNPVQFARERIAASPAHQSTALVDLT